MLVVVLARALQAITRCVRGVTHRRGRAETRGRKREWTTANVRQADKARKELYKKAAGEKEVHWDDVIKKARVPKVHASTASRSFERTGIKVQARRPRQKPMRSKAAKNDRVQKAKVMSKKPSSFYTKTIDAILDNKMWECPTTEAGKRYGKMKMVRFHLRTPSEGCKPGFTKPSPTKNKVNPGGRALVCAAIINCRIRVWYYVPERRWSGKAAANMYENVLIKALRRNRGVKRTYRVLEDNDPTGYKSSSGKAAKKKLKIVPEPWPVYSPDLMPLDYSIWKAIGDRMQKNAPKKESLSQYKLRLRRTALALPEKLIKDAVAAIPARAAAVVKAIGNDIPRD